MFDTKFLESFNKIVPHPNIEGQTLIEESQEQAIPKRDSLERESANEWKRFGSRRQRNLAQVGLFQLKELRIFDAPTLGNDVRTAKAEIGQPAVHYNENAKKLTDHSREASKRLEELSIQELVEKFIIKDSVI